MTRRSVIAGLEFALGLLTLAVGVLHFVMMGHLERMIATQLPGPAAPGLLAVFAINHVGSGVFLLVIGAMVVCTARHGLRAGKRWARMMVLIYGLGLAALGGFLLATVPRSFLTAVPFVIAVIALLAVGVLSILPILLFWGEFDEP